MYTRRCPCEVKKFVPFVISVLMIFQVYVLFAIAEKDSNGNIMLNNKNIKICCSY
ncbi:TPA: hypothetical protein ACKOR7_002214 [Clostridioides difficile]